MTSEKKFDSIYEIVTRIDANVKQLSGRVSNIEATQDQMLNRLDLIDGRLSRIELDMAKVKKCVSYENADFDPMVKAVR